MDGGRGGAEGEWKGAWLVDGNPGDGAWPSSGCFFYGGVALWVGAWHNRGVLEGRGLWMGTRETGRGLAAFFFNRGVALWVGTRVGVTYVFGGVAYHGVVLYGAWL